MDIISYVCLLLIFATTGLTGIFNGPAFPAPTSFTSSRSFQDATAAFNAALDKTLQDGIHGGGPFISGSPLNKTSFSIGMFSATDPELLYERQYTDPAIKRSSSGAQFVTGDSIFRIGSISKLFTVYLLLILDGNLIRFSDKVIDYIPELAAAPNAATEVPAAPDWTHITVGDLATHLAGLARDYGANDYAYKRLKPIATAFGLPHLDSSQLPDCGYFSASFEYIECKDQQFLRAMVTEPALFAPGHTPAYSNNGFAILGIVIERAYGSSYAQLLQKHLLDVLGMTHTSAMVPKITGDSIVPINASESGWDNVPGSIAPAAGLFSSTDDLAAMGRSILNSTFLSAASTRRWLKPRTFTDDLKYSVGAPWEIHRVHIDSRFVDIYTKDGEWGGYASYIALIPDYNIGFSILAASLPIPQAPAAIYAISKMIEKIFVPALETIAREQAEATFGGRYKSDAINSSITIVVDNKSGLKISEWVSNDVDILSVMSIELETEGHGRTGADFRLYPNLLYPAGGTIVGFTGLARWTVGSVPAWESVDVFTYGSIGIDNFVFEMDSSGRRAAVVEPLAYRIKLHRA